MTEHPVTLVCGMSGGGTRMVVDLLRQLGVDFGPRLDYSGEDSILKWPVVEVAERHGWEGCREAGENVRRTIKRLDFPTTGRMTGFKTPAQSAVFPMMHRLLPNCRVVLTARHPVILSTKERPFRTLRRQGKVDKNRPWVATAKEYQTVNERLLNYMNAEKVPYEVVRVEDLAVRPQEICDRLARFLGVEAVAPSLNIDLKRLNKTSGRVRDEVANEVWHQVRPVAERLGYDMQDYKVEAP